MGDRQAPWDAVGWNAPLGMLKSMTDRITARQFHEADVVEDRLADAEGNEADVATTMGRD